MVPELMSLSTGFDIVRRVRTGACLQNYPPYCIPPLTARADTAVEVSKHYLSV